MGNALQVAFATVMQKCVCVEVLLVLVRRRGKRLVGVSGGQEEPEAQEVPAALEGVAVQQDLQQVALVAQ